MLPEWFAYIGDEVPPGVLRLLLCLAAAGEEVTLSNGSPGLRACISVREIRRRTGLALSSICRAVRRAQADGWLEMEPRELLNLPATYILPCPAASPEDAPREERAPVKRTPPVSNAGTAPVSNLETPPVSAVGTPPVPGKRTAPPGPDGPPGSLEPRTETQPAEGVSAGGTAGGRGDGGGGEGYPGKTLSNLVDPVPGTPHHHHSPGLVKKLRAFGFADAAQVAERHTRTRIEAAIAYVESLPGVNNPGALLRKTLEEAADIPPPVTIRPAPDPALGRPYRGEFDHLIRR